MAVREQKGSLWVLDNDVDKISVHEKHSQTSLTIVFFLKFRCVFIQWDLTLWSILMSCLLFILLSTGIPNVSEFPLMSLSWLSLWPSLPSPSILSFPSPFSSPLFPLLSLFLKTQL